MSENDMAAQGPLDRGVSGPTYSGVNMSLMLERLRDNRGRVSLGNTADGKWFVTVWSAGEDSCVVIDTAGTTPFHALMMAYRVIHKDYANKDAEMRKRFIDLMAANAELSGPRPLAAEGSRSNDGLERGGKGD